MGMIEESSSLWQYLHPDMRGLLRDGEFLVADSARHPAPPLSDFSYLVFPFAKLYEGFLKKLFLDIGVMNEEEYHGDHFRIGRVLSPNLATELGPSSAYKKIADTHGTELAARLWHTWCEGRNLVFHYFPHNFRRLTRGEALELIALITNTMKESVEILGVGE